MDPNKCGSWCFLLSNPPRVHTQMYYMLLCYVVGILKMTLYSFVNFIWLPFISHLFNATSCPVGLNYIKIDMANILRWNRIQFIVTSNLVKVFRFFCEIWFILGVLRSLALSPGIILNRWKMATHSTHSTHTHTQTLFSDHMQTASSAIKVWCVLVHIQRSLN